MIASFRQRWTTRNATVCTTSNVWCLLLRQVLLFI
ncbi:hypothetical protein [Pseudoalteromonas galatheae]